MNDKAIITTDTFGITTPANDTFFNWTLSADIDEQLSILIAQRRSWDTQNVLMTARSDKHLHAILSPVYNMGLTIEQNCHPDLDIKSKFDAYCKANLIRFHKDTSYFVRICKVVFGSTGGNRYSAYGNALIAAFDAGTEMGGLVGFLEKAGGIEEARRMKSRLKGNSTTGTIANRANQSVDEVAARSVARITDSAICGLVQKDLKNGMAVMLVTLEDDGTLTLHSVSQADAIVDRVVLQAEKDSKDQPANSKEVPHTDNA